MQMTLCILNSTKCFFIIIFVKYSKCLFNVPQFLDEKDPLERGPFMRTENVPDRSIIHCIHNRRCLRNEMAKVWKRQSCINEELRKWRRTATLLCYSEFQIPAKINSNSTILCYSYFKQTNFYFEKYLFLNIITFRDNWKWILLAYLFSVWSEVKIITLRNK